MNMQDLTGKDEDLHPELAAHQQEGSFGTGIYHPLVHQPLHNPAMNAWANAVFAQKTARLKRAVAEKDWNTFIYLHERPYRNDAIQTLLTEHGGDIPDKTYWELVSSAWTDSENIHQNFDEWLDMWTADRPGRIEHAMDDEERAALAALPDPITVWRGVQHIESARGMSWTTDEKKAIWFARRFAKGRGKTAILLTGTVRKRDVLAYLLGRGESEIVVHPDDVEITDEEHV